MRKIYLLFFFHFFVSVAIFSQGFFSGDLELRNDYYIRDTVIGASGTNHFDDLKSSVDSWFSLNYQNPDIQFDAGIRLDLFLNSRFHNPNQDAYQGFGVGIWYLRKKFNRLTLTGGYFYDQFGSGIAFRAFENRFLGIDNAIFGVHGRYDITDNFTVKAFAGLQKNRMEIYKSVLKGMNAEGFVELGDKITMIPGGSVLNRTMDEESMSLVANVINNYPNVEDRFVPKYNTYLFSAYNTMNFGNFSWFIEAGYKTPEAIIDIVGAPYVNKAGNIVFTNFTYSQKGFGITSQFKRTDHFQFRNSPESRETILQSAFNFIPPTNRQNALRLPARYAPASQEVEETAFSLDFTYTPIKGKTFNFSFSEIHRNNVNLQTYAQNVLFRELYADMEWRVSKKLSLFQGFQFLIYNREFYEGPAGYPTAVYAYSPFFEMSYKFDRKKSLRFEFQYQSAEQDFGQWLYALIEFNIAPKFSISVSDMWNFNPGPNASSIEQHYYSVYASYTEKQHRFFFSYVKQVEGIVCTGGICRLEPAFNGIRAGVNTSF